MIEVSGSQAKVAGAMTLVTASHLLMAGKAALATADQFDLSAVTEIDSSGLAVVFAWVRAARKQGKEVRLVNVPADLLSMAEVYDVVDLLPPH